MVLNQAELHADEASTDEEGITPVALDSSSAVPHQQRALNVRKTTARLASALLVHMVADIHLGLSTNSQSHMSLLG